MRDFLAVLIAVLLTTMHLTAQEWVWGLKATGNHQWSGDTDIAVDNKGNSVVTGYYQKSFTLDGHSLLTKDDYYSDIFLGKVDSKGRVLWLNSIEAGDTYYKYNGLSTDDDKNIYLTGSRNSHIFVSKYDSTGVLIWNTDFDNKYYGFGRDIAIDQFDNVYVIGGNGWNFFMAKLNYFGEPVWTKDIWVNYSNGFNANDIDVDAMGNIYFAATFEVDSIQLDEIVIKQKASTFWGKIDTNGKFIWAKAASGRTSENPQIALTADNQLFISGSFSTSLIIENTHLQGLCCSDHKPFIAKYDTEGNFKWAKAGYTTYEGKGSTSDIKVDYDGNLYLTGNYYHLDSDFYLEKYLNNGDFVWRKEFKNGNSDYSHSIDIDNNGFIYNVGNTGAEDLLNQQTTSMTSSIMIGKLNTLAATPKRPLRPIINRVYYFCEENRLISLRALGQNIKWYDTSDLSNQIHSGEFYEKEFQKTDTLYVTQTIGNIESWAKEVIIYKTDFDPQTIKYAKDTLSVAANNYLSYKWSYNGNLIDHAQANYYVPKSNGIYTLALQGGDCTKILSYSFERPKRPETDSLIFVCSNEPLEALKSTGENVIWYADNSYKDTLFIGNQYSPSITTNQSYYVRQTVNGIASYPQIVKIEFSELKDLILNYGAEYIYTNYNKKFAYQWYWENDIIENADSNLYVPNKNGLYTVVIKDSQCQKSLSRYYVCQPKISTNIYTVCSNDKMPIINAEGENLSWWTYNMENWRIENLGTGNSFTPTFNESKDIYLTQMSNSYTSYPLQIKIIKAKFSDLKYYQTDYNIGFEGKGSTNYKYLWYFNGDSVPLYQYNSVYYPNYGNYKVKVSIDNNCDTVFNVNYYPKFDSIVYVCSEPNPTIQIGNNDLSWYSDVNLTQLVNQGSTFYTYLNGKDATFYLAQVRYNKVTWRDEIKVVFPTLEKLTITKNENGLAINYPQTYFKYTWFYEDSLIDFNGPNCLLDKEGIYSVIVQAGDCSVKLFYSYTNTSVYRLVPNTAIKIYPNPTRDYVSIVLNELISENIQAKLYSGNGQLILSKHYRNPEIILDMSYLDPGTYILTLQTGSKFHHCKIVKL